VSFASAWMPFFGGNFWESERVAGMDDSAGLLYIWLTWREFTNGPLPSPDMLRRIPHRWHANWDAVWPQVATCFDVLEDGRLSNPVCAEQRRIALENSDRARRSGAMGGLARAAKLRPAAEPQSEPQRGSEDATASAAQAPLEAPLETPGKGASGPNQNEPNRTEPEPSRVQTQKRRRKRPPVETSEPDWLALPNLNVPAMRDAWAKWVAHRRELKAPEYTSQSLPEALGKLAGMGPDRALAAVRHSIASNWRSVHETSGEATRTSRPTPENSMRALFEAERVRTERHDHGRTIDVDGGRTA